MRYRLVIVVGIVVAAATALSAQPVYQLHDNGNIWVSSGVPCSGVSCPGWHLLGNNPGTVEITAAGVPAGGFDSTKASPDAPPLYQRRADGTILFYTGTPCNGRSCTGWQMIDKNPLTVSIVAAGTPIGTPPPTHLYKRHSDGAIWSYTGKPCVGESCPGWQQLDNNNRTVEMAAAGEELYQRRGDGTILRYKGTPCSSPTSCPEWELLDSNSSALEITAHMVGNRVELYQRQVEKILRYRSTGWELLDNNTRTISIVAGEFLYQLRNDGEILFYNGPAGWQLLDKNTRNRQIAAGPRSLYKLQDDGAVLRYTGPQCEAGSCWQLLDTNPKRTLVSSRN